MKYLIVKCTRLNDPYECDADRTPVRITDDPSGYGLGYEVWEVQEDRTLVRVKDCDTANESGMALYFWSNEAKEGDAPTVLAKFPNVTQHEVSAEMVANVIRMANFTAAGAEKILYDVHRFGNYGEEGDDCWMMFGEYQDDCFDLGY